MITRVVKLTFKPEHCDEFIEIFNESRNYIRNCNGNTYLAMYRDIKDPTIFFTISKWLNEDNLNAYRNSEYFNLVWERTKALFNDKPEAWTLDELQTDGIWK